MPVQPGRLFTASVASRVASAACSAVMRAGAITVAHCASRCTVSTQGWAACRATISHSARQPLGPSRSAGVGWCKGARTVTARTVSPPTESATLTASSLVKVAHCCA
jgi:dienelactone hydrolase